MDLDEVLNVGKSNSALGSYFESIAHQMLRHGGDFDARSYRFQWETHAHASSTGRT